MGEHLCIGMSARVWRKVNSQRPERIWAFWRRIIWMSCLSKQPMMLMTMIRSKFMTLIATFQYFQFCLFSSFFLMELFVLISFAFLYTVFCFVEFYFFVALKK